MPPRALDGLLRRLRKPIFRSRDDVLMTAVALVDLCAFFEAPGELHRHLSRFARADASLSREVCAALRFDPGAPRDGRRLAAVSRMPFATAAGEGHAQLEAMQAVAAAVSAALCPSATAAAASSASSASPVTPPPALAAAAGRLPCAWPAADLHAVLQRVASWGLAKPSGANGADLAGGMARLALARAAAAVEEPGGEEEDGRASVSMDELYHLACALLAVLPPEPPAAGAGDASGSPSGVPAAEAALSRVLSVLAARGEELAPALAGMLCARLNRTRRRHPGLALALQEEASRLAEDADVYPTVQAFEFVARHDADVVSPEALEWLMERVLGAPLDAQATRRLLRAAAGLPASVRAALPGLPAFLSHLLAQAAELLAVPLADGGVMEAADRPAAAAQDFIAALLALPLHLWATPPPPPPSSTSAPSPAAQPPAGYAEAVDACAAFVAAHAEAMVAAENPPFALVPRLLGPASTPAGRAAGVALLRECMAQRRPLPTLLTFRYLLLMGDGQLRDAAVFRYLRDQFAKTAADIPPVQLCAALQCLRHGLAAEETAAEEKDKAASSGGSSGSDEEAAAAAEVAAEMEREDMESFFRFCKEKVRGYLGTGLPLRCALAAVEALHSLGCADEAFYAEMASYMDTKLAKASPAVHDRAAAAAACLALGEDTLDAHPALHTFLLEAGATGEAPAAGRLSPTEWMNLHDPSNSVAPLTEAQRESWDVVERMVAARADRTEELTALAREYLRLLPHARPDDHKYFFGVFEEKVLKEDKLLKTCLESLVESGACTKLSDTTVAAILSSLAALRFAYSRTTKRFLSALTAEQWAEMEAAPLVQILAAMSRMSLRGLPLLEADAAPRLTALVPFLSPFDTSEAVHALQALGCRDEALLRALVAHAAAAAGRHTDASLTVLFAAPAVHRLLRDPGVAAPLLTAAAGKVQSPDRRARIAKSLARTGLPRDVIEGANRSLLAPPGASSSGRPLRLSE